jgi:hypothetical protein
MIWGEHINRLRDPEEKLLYWVIMCLIEPRVNAPLERWLSKVLRVDGGLSGDPGWSIDRIAGADGGTYYEVSADPGYSAVPFSSKIYKEEQVYDAIRATLKLIAQIYPARADEVATIMKLYRLHDG